MGKAGGGNTHNTSPIVESKIRGGWLRSHFSSGKPEKGRTDEEELTSSATATPTITPTPRPDTLLYSMLDLSGQAVAVRMEVTAGDLALVFLGLVQLTLLVVAFVVAVVRGRV